MDTYRTKSIQGLFISINVLFVSNLTTQCDFAQQYSLQDRIRLYFAMLMAVGKN